MAETSTNEMLKTADDKPLGLAAEKMLEVLYEHVSDLIAVVDQKNHTVWRNKAYWKKLGFTAKDLAQGIPQTHIHEDDIPKLVYARHKAFETGQGGELEYRILSKEGQWIHLESTSAVISEMPELGTCLVFVARDISKRKMREAEEQRRQKRLSVQKEAFMRLSLSEDMYDGDWESSLQSILSVTGDTLDVAQVRIWFFNDEDDCLYTGKSLLHILEKKKVGKDIEKRIKLEVTKNKYLKQLRGERLIKVENVKKDKRVEDWFYDYCKKHNIKSVMHVPLMRNAELAGVLSCEHVGGDRHWSEDEQSFATSMGDMVVLILEERDRQAALQALAESQRKLAGELAEAAAYVRSLLPAPIEKGPISADWIFHSSTALGGDCLGYHWVDKDCFAMYVLDVCGHGVGAALLSISAKNVFSTHSLRDTDFKDPSSVLKNASITFDMDRQNSMFFTLWYGVYNTKTHVLEYGCAGNPPAVLITPGQKRKGKKVIQQLEAKGPPVGVVPGFSYKKQSVKVPDKSYLYIFTDGIYEIDDIRSGKQWGYDDFLETLKDAKNDAHTALNRVLDKAKAISGQDNFEDDITLMRFNFNRKAKQDGPIYVPAADVVTKEASASMPQALKMSDAKSSSVLNKLISTLKK